MKLNENLPRNGKNGAPIEIDPHAIEQRIMSGVTASDLSESIRARIFSDGGDKYVRWVVDNLGSNRTATNHFGKLVIEAGRAKDIFTEIERALGGRKVPVALSALEAVEQASAMDDPTKARRMLEWLSLRGVDVSTIVLPESLRGSGAEVVDGP